MWTAIGLICGFVCLLLAVIVLTKKVATKQAELESLISEAKERKRANKIMDTVRSMSADDVCNRLQNLSDK